MLCGQGLVSCLDCVAREVSCLDGSGCVARGLVSCLLCGQGLVSCLDGSGCVAGLLGVHSSCTV